MPHDFSLLQIAVISQSIFVGICFGHSGNLMKILAAFALNPTDKKLTKCFYWQKIELTNFPDNSDKWKPVERFPVLINFRLSPLPSKAFSTCQTSPGKNSAFLQCRFEIYGSVCFVCFPKTFLDVT